MQGEIPMPIAMTGDDASKPARGSTAQVFERLALPFRRAITLHCYRMLGSLHEAEDAVQETYLRAWRGFDRLQDRGAVRPWLYRIATHACLDALVRRRHVSRLLPDQHAPASRALPNGVPATDVAWLEPLPESYLEGLVDESPGPEARYAARDAVRLAFVAAIQALPARQRAVLLLRDVLGWSAAEVAPLLGGSTASVNSALQRARGTLARRFPEGRPEVTSRPDPAQQALLDRYLLAWERLEPDGLVALLTEDAIFTMPPLPQWYRGRRAIRDLFAWAWPAYQGFHMMPIAANGEPAFAAYARAGADAPWTAHSIHVLSVEPGGIARLTMFFKPPERVFAMFDLPPFVAPEAAN